MKKTKNTLTGFIIFILTIFSSHVFSQSLSDKKLKARTLEILKKYDAEAYKIITDYENAPSSYTIQGSTINFGGFDNDKGFLVFIDGNTEQSIIDNINTVVHESNHGYTGRMIYQMLEKNPDISYDFGSNYYAYFINSGEQILVKVTSTFPSRKLVKHIPKDLQTFRFETYISEAPDIQSTQQHGIYGLLGEMNSYYLGTKTSFLLYDYYLKEKKVSGNEWLDYMQDIDGTLYACWEFKYYILKYLLYAKEKEQDIYKATLGNENFCKAFLNTDKNAVKLAEDYFAKRKKILDDLKAKGMEVNITDKYTFIGGKGVGNFMDTLNLLKSELAKKEYMEMMEVIKNPHSH